MLIEVGLNLIESVTLSANFETKERLLIGRKFLKTKSKPCYLGVAQIEQWKRLVLTQMCNRHAKRANVNKASKQAKRGECLPCERLVQGKRHVEKKALLARHFIAILRS